MNEPVISLGGSIFLNGDERHLFDFINKIKKHESYAIVVGGGKIARDRISKLRDMGVGEYHLDKMGIQATRLNAMMISLALGNLMDTPRSIDEAVVQMRLNNKVIMGGTEPGHTTDAVSLLLAEALGWNSVVNITNVEGLFDKDPRVKGAKKIVDATYSSVIELITAQEKKAGQNFPIDLLSLNIARRSKIQVKVVSFKNMKNVLAAISGKSFEGTLIR